MSHVCLTFFCFSVRLQCSKRLKVDNEKDNAEKVFIVTKMRESTFLYVGLQCSKEKNVLKCRYIK